MPRKHTQYLPSKIPPQVRRVFAFGQISATIPIFILTDHCSGEYPFCSPVDYPQNEQLLRRTSIILKPLVSTSGIQRNPLSDIYLLFKTSASRCDVFEKKIDVMGGFRSPPISIGGYKMIDVVPIYSVGNGQVL